MPRPIIVIDDDIELVTELRHAHTKNFPYQQIVGPPELPLDLRGIREHIVGVSVIVLDLNIGGSSTYGQALLKALCRDLKRSDIPVIVWSKYLRETIVFEPAGIFRLSLTEPSSPVQAIEEAGLERLVDYGTRIKPLRTIYQGVRAFVSKATPEPVNLLLRVFARLGVITRES
jgi:hypothetical protein